MVALAAKAVEGGAADRIAQAAHLLLGRARILEGETPADPARFAQALVESLSGGSWGIGSRQASNRQKVWTPLGKPN